VFVNIYVSAVGVTAGAHRLWSHKAYQANLPLRILLATIFTMSGQVSLSAREMSRAPDPVFTYPFLT